MGTSNEKRAGPLRFTENRLQLVNQAKCRKRGCIQVRSTKGNSVLSVIPQTTSSRKGTWIIPIDQRAGKGIIAEFQNDIRRRYADLLAEVGVNLQVTPDFAFPEVVWRTSNCIRITWLYAWFQRRKIKFIEDGGRRNTCTPRPDELNVHSSRKELRKQKAGMPSTRYRYR